jgi:signal transduction histidine kinase
MLVGLIAGTLALLWGIQLGFISSVSRIATISCLHKTADALGENIDHENLIVLANALSYRENVSVLIVDTEGNIFLKTETRASIISTFSASELAERFSKAKDEGGVYLEKQSHTLENLEGMGFTGKYANITDETECHIYTKLYTSASGQQYAIIVEATGMPVSTIHFTMVVQLLFISVIVIAATFFLAFLMSRAIAKPIVSLNLSAKNLAKGKSDVVFTGGGYKEIEELRDSLNIASKELSAVDHYRKELIANVSHDLKTPLTLIKGYAELMREIPSEATPDNIQVIIDETTRLTGLVNDMLDISKLQEGGSRLNLEEFDLVALAEEIVNRYSRMLEAKGYHFDFEHEPSAYAFGDRAKIAQVIYNLISNAVNYCGADKLVKVRVFHKNNNVRLEVIDNGEGIDVSILPYIWDRYYKSEKSHRRAEAGTGLGLSIVKSVMSLHPGGIYGVESSVGRGSKFYFQLPLMHPNETKKGLPDK